jgi:oleate hydratase
LRLTRSDGSPQCIPVGPGDAVLLTVGSMTADCGYGDGRRAADLVRNRRDGSWRLWEALAAHTRDFGAPHVFGGDIARSRRHSFTLTMGDRTLPDRVAALAPDGARCGLTAFPDSAWQLTVGGPAQPHLRALPSAHTLWGWATRPDTAGDFVGKPMSDCTGTEILDELFGHLDCDDIAATVRPAITVTTVQLPYATAPLQPRRTGDRPRVVPDQARNFAFLGQFVELPQGRAGTLDYAVRSAMTAVYHHFPVDREIPPAQPELVGARQPWFRGPAVDTS